MKWITTTIVVALALATNSCVKGQDVINFVLDQEDAKGIRGQQQLKPSRSESEFENEEVLVDTLSLLPKKALVKKSESVGILSHEKKSTFVDPHDQTVEVLSAPQDFEYRQAQAQERRLESGMDLATFEARCDASVAAAFPGAGLSGSDAYVNCVGGFVSGTTTSQTCADACGGKCCTGSSDATGFAPCEGFTGKVCKDGSCDITRACRNANIDYVVDSCSGVDACEGATIGSVFSSCNGVGGFSCEDALLSGVDLNNSCNESNSCLCANGNGEIAELIDCCNDEDGICEELVGRIDIVAAGGPSCRALTSAPTSVPSQSSAPSEEPSQEPSEVPSFVPSDSPSTSVEPSSSPTKSGKVNSEKSGKSKSSKVDSRNMASKLELLEYLSNIDLSSDEKKALVLILIIGILEHFGDTNEMD